MAVSTPSLKVYVEPVLLPHSWACRPQLPLPSAVTITANPHFAVNRWNSNYAGAAAADKKGAAAAADVKTPSQPGATAPGSGGGGGGPATAAQPQPKAAGAAAKAKAELQGIIFRFPLLGLGVQFHC